MENIGVRFGIVILPWMLKWARSKLSWCTPIDISTHKGSKREKIRKKWRKNFHYPYFCRLYIAKQAYYIQLTRCTDKKRRVKDGARERNDQGEKKPQRCRATSSHACAMRAHHLQQFSFFAVTSVTHASKRKGKSRKSHPKKGRCDDAIWLFCVKVH